MTESLEFLREADDLLPKVGDGSTLVIHLEDPSTDFLKDIYAGKGYEIITGQISPQELAGKIKAHERIFMLGHGGPGGLFGPGYQIDYRFGKLLSSKTGLFIWCHAVEYAHDHRLTGLVSGMFISEVGEAYFCGIKATQEEVTASNYFFSAAVRNYLDTGVSPHTVKDCYNSATCKVTQYNNERLYVMRQGQILDQLGQELSKDVSAKRGSPRYWEVQDRGREEIKPKRRKPEQGAYGNLDEPPDEFKSEYGWPEEGR